MLFRSPHDLILHILQGQGVARIRDVLRLRGLLRGNLPLLDHLFIRLQQLRHAEDLRDLA